MMELMSGGERESVPLNPGLPIPFLFCERHAAKDRQRRLFEAYPALFMRGWLLQHLDLDHSRKAGSTFDLLSVSNAIFLSFSSLAQPASPDAELSGKPAGRVAYTSKR
jgi:hypothetical protein